MGKMRRLLAAVLVASMLFGTNGVSYAAETIADGASQETTVEETTEAVTEEVTEPEKQDDVTETAAAEENTSGSEQDEQDAVEPASADMAADTTDEVEPSKEEVEADQEEEKTAEDTQAEEVSTEGKDMLPVTDGAESTPEVKTEEDKPAVRTEYTYSDEDVDVKAVLQQADAVPDDAALVVTRVTADTDGYKYDAYMEALNDQAEEGKEYNSDNTLLYDIAFMYEEKDAEGNGTGKIVEYQPDPGTVEIQIEFKQDQLNNQFSAEETENVEILHLPLTDSVREAVETTAAATEISKDDIIVEPVQDENIDVKSESVGFTVTGLSLIALAAPKKAPTSPLKAPATGTISGEVRLFEKDGTTPLNNQDVINTGFEPYKGHGVLVYIKNKDGDKSVAGWQIVDITKHANYSAVTPFEFDAANFHVFKNEGKEYDAETVAFDPEKHDVVFRLYNTWSNVSGCNFYDIINNQNGIDDTFNGMTFLGTTEEDGKYVISLKEASDTTYNVKVQFDDADELESGNYYVLVEVAHATTGNTYVLEKITQAEQDILFENYGTEANPWKTKDGGTKVEKFTGNEKTTAYLIWSEDGNLSIADAVDAKNCVKYGSQATLDKQTSDDGTTDTYTQIIDFKNYEPATNDYNCESILGPGILYGITADSFEQLIHIQSNFATNHYTNPDGMGTEPDLAGNSGVIVAADCQDKIFIGTSHKSDILIYSNKSKADTIKDDRDFVYVVTDTTSNLSENYVEPAISYGDQTSDELISHNPNIYPTIDSNRKVLIDSTAYPDDATIYVDADAIYSAISTSGALLIRKNPDQVIVFNIDETSDISLEQFNVQYPDMSSYSGDVTHTVDGYEGDWILSDTPMVTGAKNDAIDEIAQHIVWNLNSATNVTLNAVTGMVLVPNENSDTKLNGTCSGWIITDGKFSNPGGEWHSVYKNLPDIDTATLKASKTVDGKPAKSAEKFEFSFEYYDPFEEDFADLETVINKGASVSCKITNLNKGWNIYKITEKKIAEGTEGNYTLDENVYYAAVKYVIMNEGEENQVAYAGLPQYYSNFDKASFNKDSDTVTGVSGPLTKIEFRNESVKSGLKIKKTVENAPEGAQDVFTFTLTLKQPQKDPTTGEIIKDQDDNIVYENISETFPITGVTVIDGTDVTKNDSGMTITFTNGTATIKLKGGEEAVITEIPEGDFYTAAESGDLPEGVTLTSPERDAEGKQVISGTISSTSTELAEFVNTYEEKKGSLSVKKTIVGARLTNDKTFKFTVVDKDGKYYYLEGTETKTSTDAKYVEVTVPAFGLTAESNVLNVPLGDYTVTEYTGTEYSEIKIADYSVKSVSDPVTAVVNAASATTPVTATITNTYVKDGKATLKVEKALGEGDTWPDGKSAVFTLTADGEAPMPTADGGNTVTLTEAGVEGFFGTITYPLSSAGETYTYKITETGDFGDGWTKDGPITVTVEVGEDGGTGSLGTTVTYSPDTFTITNDYDASGTATLKVKKALGEGDTWPDGKSAVFTLTADGEAPMPTADGGNTVTLTEAGVEGFFGTITYPLSSANTTYEYTISEELTGWPVGWTKSGDIKVKVAVGADTGSGELSTTVTYSTDGGETYGNEAEFYTITNTYVVTGTATIKVEKAVSGTRWPNGGEVTFTIARQAGEANTEAPLPDPLTTEVQTEAGEKNFSAVTLGKKDIGKIYYYEITENAKGFDVNAGWSVTPEKIIVKMEVGEPNDQAILIPTVTYSIDGGATYGDASSFYTITNKYESSGEIDLEVNKKMVGRPINISVDEEERFAFGLYIFHPVLRGANADLRKNWEPVGDYVFCDNTGKATFSHEDENFKNVLTFTQKDITSWNEDGTGTGTKEFRVAEVIPGDAVNAAGKKYADATDDERDAGGFKKDGYTYDSSIKSITVNLLDDGKGNITATVADDSDELEFTNTYAAEGEIVLHAQKKLSGARKLEEGQFTFELIEVIEKDDSEVEKVIDTKKNDAKGTVTFDPIKYTQEDIYDVDEDGVYSGPGTKDFRYKIREVIPEGAVDNMDGTFYYEGYTYDATVYELVVTATDNGDGTITAVDAADEATDGQKPAEEKYVFVNAYEAVGGLKLNAEKTYKNGTLRGGEFTFELRDADGKVLQSRKNDAAGYVYFEPLSYELEDAANAPFTYTVREVPGSRTDVKYDATVYTVTVSLEDNGDGTLKVTKKIDNGGALKFVNEQLNVETSVTIGGEKVLKGGTLKNGQFKFVLADASGKWVDTATNDADGNFTFKPITYKLSDLNGEKAKVFTYGVSEVKGSESRITYDEKVYTVKVTVTDNGDGTMTAKADLAKSDIKFVNREEKKKKDNTKTGDEAPLGVLFGGLGIGAAGLAVLLEDRKRRNRNK